MTRKLTKVELIFEDVDVQEVKTLTRVFREWQNEWRKLVSVKVFKNVKKSS